MRAGRDVLFVARGARLEAMRRDGLHGRASCRPLYTSAPRSMSLVSWHTRREAGLRPASRLRAGGSEDPPLLRETNDLALQRLEGRADVGRRAREVVLPFLLRAVEIGRAL